jgi:hypothetical protein
MLVTTLIAAPSVLALTALFVIQNWSEMRGGTKSNL